MSGHRNVGTATKCSQAQSAGGAKDARLKKRKMDLKRVHKNNVAYLSLLEKRPSITYAITYYLLNNKEFPSTGMIVDKIKKLFKSLGWNYSSSYISNAMARNSRYIGVSGTDIVDGNEVNIYKLK